MVRILSGPAAIGWGIGVSVGCDMQAIGHCIALTAILFGVAVLTYEIAKLLRKRLLFAQKVVDFFA